MDKNAEASARRVSQAGCDSTRAFERALDCLTVMAERLATLRDQIWHVQVLIEDRIASNETFLAEQQVRLQNGIAPGRGRK